MSVGAGRYILMAFLEFGFYYPTNFSPKDIGYLLHMACMQDSRPMNAKVRRLVPIGYSGYAFIDFTLN